MTSGPIDTGTDTGAQGPAISRWSGLLQILALSSIAVAQPLFEVMQRHTTFLVAHRVQRIDLILLACLLGLGVGLALAIPFLLSRTLGNPRLSSGVLAVTQVGLVALLVSPLVKRVPAFGGLIGWLVPLALGAVAALLLARVRWVSRFAALLCVAALGLPLLFLLQQPVSDLWASQGVIDGAVQRSETASTTPVVLVVLDELPLASLLTANGEVDERLFPGFAQLARASVFYRNTTTVSEMTSASITGLLTGRYPEKGGQLPTLEHYPKNLFTFVESSHDLHAFEASSRLSPLVEQSEIAPLRDRLKLLSSDLALVYLHLVTPRNLASQLLPVDQGWRGFRQREQPWRPGVIPRREGAGPSFDWYNPQEGWRRFVEGIERSPLATVHYLHRVVPHVPWRRLPDGHSYKPPKGIMQGETWSATEWQAVQALQRHLLQVGFVDSLLGSLLGELKRLELWDRSLVILVSDHGASFDPSLPRRRLPPGERSSLPDIAMVPLFVKYPGQTVGRVEDRPVQTVDVLPTVLQELGIATTEQVDGRPLQEFESPPERWLFPERDRSNSRGPIALGLESLLTESRILRLKSEYFKPAGWPGVYHLGLSRVQELASFEELAASLDQEAWLADVDLLQEALPVWLSGRLEEGQAEGSLVLVELNGRSAFATEVLAGGRFAGLAPPELLRPGANRIAVRSARTSHSPEVP